MTIRLTLICAIVAGLLGLPGCALQPHQAYVPGLGEIMSATQMRHTKLWFAGRAGNWPLAAYEVKELREGFGDAVRLHPEHEGAPQPVARLLPEMTDPPLKALDAAIRAQDGTAFAHAYDALTDSCNACHEAEDFGFNVVRRPTHNPYTDQQFTTGADKAIKAQQI